MLVVYNIVFDFLFIFFNLRYFYLGNDVVGIVYYLLRVYYVLEKLLKLLEIIYNLS